MNNKFDELTKAMAQSVTRRAALKKFGVGLAGMALACFGLAHKARAATYSGYCQVQPQFVWPGQKDKTTWVGTGMCFGVDPVTGNCLGYGGICPIGELSGHAAAACGGHVAKNTPCSFTF